MSKRVHVLQHVWFEGPGWISAWAQSRGHQLQVFRASEGERLPRAADLDLLIVLGGPMSVHDDYPWLDLERALLREVLATPKPILAICLGAQLLTQVLGGEVYRAERPEIGWFDVFLEPSPFFSETSFKTLHWHAEAFTLPPGATLLGRSQITPVQAYSVNGNKLALQFHPEMDLAAVKLQTQECASDLEPGAADELLGHAPDLCKAHETIIFSLLDRLLET